MLSFLSYQFKRVKEAAHPSYPLNYFKPLSPLVKKTYQNYTDKQTEVAISTKSLDIPQLSNYKTMHEIANLWRNAAFFLKPDSVKLLLVKFREGYAWDIDGEIYQIESQHVSVVINFFSQYYFSVGNITANSYCTPLKQHGQFISAELLDGTKKYKITKVMSNYNNQNETNHKSIVTSKVWSKCEKAELEKKPNVISVMPIENSGQYFISTKPVAYQDVSVLTNFRIPENYLKNYSSIILNYVRNIDFTGQKIAYYSTEGLIKTLHPQLPPSNLRTHVKSANKLTNTELRVEKIKEMDAAKKLLNKTLKRENENENEI